jgi:hypothetical protein
VALRARMLLLLAVRDWLPFALLLIVGYRSAWC